MAYRVMIMLFLVFFTITLFFQYDVHFDLEYKQAGSRAVDDEGQGEIPLSRKFGSTELNAVPCSQSSSSRESDPATGKGDACRPPEMLARRGISFTVSWHPPSWGAVAYALLYAAVPTVVVYLVSSWAISTLEEATNFF